VVSSSLVRSIVADGKVVELLDCGSGLIELWLIRYGHFISMVGMV
jgi:hypothetical protein